MGLIFGLSMVSTALAQTSASVNLRGKVTSASGAGIAGAEVVLMGRQLKDTTDASGNFVLISASASLFNEHETSAPRDYSIHQSGLRYKLPAFKHIHTGWFDLVGRRLGGPALRHAVGDSYKGEEISALPTVYSSDLLAKRQAVIDSIRVIASDYDTIHQPIESYDTEVNLVLRGKTKTCREWGSELRNKVGGVEPAYQVLSPNGGEVFTTGQLLKIRVSNYSMPSIRDESDTTFTISALR